MTKDSIIQFVCFVTNLGPDQFISEWEPYAKKLQPKKQELNLLELVGTAKNKFRYVSQHPCPGADFNFAFMNKSRSEHFPEHNIRVVQVGGYILISGKKYAEKDGDVKMIAFLSHNEIDIDFYRRLPSFHHLDIYQAYYESCTYGHILEFWVAETDADELLLQLQQRHGVESGIYKECSVTA
jgi:hypothetical protein